MYSEMEFDYNGESYSVLYYKSKEKEKKLGAVEFGKYEENFKQFTSTQDFKNNASIDGKLLKDVWKDVKNARYMQCE